MCCVERVRVFDKDPAPVTCGFFFPLFVGLDSCVFLVKHSGKCLADLAWSSTACSLLSGETWHEFHLFLQLSLTAPPNPTPAHSAVCLSRLLAAGVDPNAVCFPAHGFTPLHCVVSHDAQIASAAMRCLIAAGADVNIRDGEGETPVMSAAAMGIPGAIVFLAQHGADLTLRNSKGKSAYDIAKDPYEGSPECTEVLVELGFDPAAHPPPAIPIPAPSRVEMAVSSNGAAKGRIAFVGVDSSIYDAREVNPEIASFYNGHDAHKLQTMEWSEGCDIFEAMPGSGQLDPDRYTTVVTSEHLVSENSAVLQVQILFFLVCFKCFFFFPFPFSEVFLLLFDILCFALN